MTPEGGKPLIESEVFRTGQEEMLEALIGRLAYDGWEPIPIGTSALGITNINWCFKRSLSPNVR
jgi:hypothetical protein